MMQSFRIGTGGFHLQRDETMPRPGAHALVPRGARNPLEGEMAVKGGRVDFLAPHLLRGQLLRPGFVRLTLRLGVARHMPGWARLQFTNGGVTTPDLDRVLSRVTSLETWVDEWESLAREHEQSGRDALKLDQRAGAVRHFLASSAAYNYAQYVIFLDMTRKRTLH